MNVLLDEIAIRIVSCHQLLYVNKYHFGQFANLAIMLNIASVGDSIALKESFRGKHGEEKKVATRDLISL